MIIYKVIIFLIWWQYTSGQDLDNLSIESVLDQVAIPTKIINEFLQKPTKTTPLKKFNFNERVDSSTIHYENSNGFVPMTNPSKPYNFENKRYNKTKNTNDFMIDKQTIKSTNAENDLKFSKESKIFLNLPNQITNRRSFNADNNKDEFELLKVSNGTPSVANYDKFYHQTRDMIRSDRSQSTSGFKKLPRNKDRDRGKRIQQYLGNYDAAENNDANFNNQKKTIHHQANTDDHYKQESLTNYYSEKPRASYTPMTKTKPNTNFHTSNSNSNDPHSFKSPIMVEPSAYKVDVRFTGQSVQTVVSTPNLHSDKKDQINSVQSENNVSQNPLQTEGTSRNYDSADSRDFSEEDYVDEVDQPRRSQKSSRRRPYHFDSSRKLPKEHRETYEDMYDNQGRKRQPKYKSRYRQKPQPVTITNDDDQYDDVDDVSNQQNFNEGNTWNQITPNVEVSHSNGFEVNQIEKPKLHIVPLNILSNFDHATALDNSQGFDITNAMITSFINGDGTVSTASPLLSSTPNSIDHNPISSSTSKSHLGLSTSVPDVIVGQSSFHSPVQVYMPNKHQNNMFSQLMQSTMAPAIFAVTSRPGYSASSTASSNLQQLLSQVQGAFNTNQNSNSQQSNSNNQFNINTHGFQGQNLNSYQNSQTTTAKPFFDSQKKKFNNNNGQFVASASLSVDQGTHRLSNHRDRNTNSKRKNKHNYNTNYNNQNSEDSEDYNNSIQSDKKSNRQNLNAAVQPTVVPTILHTGFGLLNNQNQQLSPILIATAQPQFDSYVGASNNVNAINNLVSPIQKAQLPILGAKNVEIINPNLNGNAYAINQIPAALVTTPIPIFTTTGFVASKPSISSTSQDSSGQDRQLYNPINFVPNYDLMKSQSILNQNIVPNDIFSQQNLNLVSLVPGGNFYKHSQGAQVDLANKPKLSSDLEKYAEEMFKESLRTIYNSHKWNNDLRSPGTISLVDNSELAKLRNELLRIKTNYNKDSKVPKDVLEAHHTEHKIKTTRPAHDYKHPDSSIEQSHKHHYHPGSHHHSHNHKHKHHISDHLTPPKFNSFISKSLFHDKPPKKRPGHGPRPNLHHEHNRPHPRQGIVAVKPASLDTQGTSLINYQYPVRLIEKNHFVTPDYRRFQTYNNYPTFTTPYPENDPFKASTEIKSGERDIHDVNHQRTHNLMGLLMKNKQLPMGIQSNFYSDKQIDNFFNTDNKRVQSQAYQDIFRSFQKKSDKTFRPIVVSEISQNQPKALQKV